MEYIPTRYRSNYFKQFLFVPIRDIIRMVLIASPLGSILFVNCSIGKVFVRRLLFAFVLCLLPTTSSRAQDVNPSSAAGSARRVQLIEDQKQGAVRVVIDGKEIARIDSNGLHVRENIEYGGYALDSGQGVFDKYVAEARDAK